MNLVTLRQQYALLTLSPFDRGDKLLAPAANNA